MILKLSTKRLKDGVMEYCKLLYVEYLLLSNCIYDVLRVRRFQYIFTMNHLRLLLSVHPYSFASFPSYE